MPTWEEWIDNPYAILGDADNCLCLKLEYEDGDVPEEEVHDQILAMKMKWS